MLRRKREPRKARTLHIELDKLSTVIGALRLRFVTGQAALGL